MSKHCTHRNLRKKNWVIGVKIMISMVSNGIKYTKWLKIGLETLGRKLQIKVQNSLKSSYFHPEFNWSDTAIFNHKEWVCILAFKPIIMLQ